MGHYCRICGRTRSNEKFSGKGHKNHVCKNCSGKSGKKAQESILDKDSQASEDLISLFGEMVQSEQTSIDDSWFYENEFEIRGYDEDDFDDEGSDEAYEDIPF